MILRLELWKSEDLHTICEMQVRNTNKKMPAWVATLRNLCMYLAKAHEMNTEYKMIITFQKDHI